MTEAGAQIVGAGAASTRSACTAVAVGSPTERATGDAAVSGGGDARGTPSVATAHGKAGGTSPSTTRIRFPLRPYRKSGCSFVLLVIRFSVPLLVLLLFFGVKYAITLNQIDAALRSGTTAIVASFRASEVGESYLAICAAILTNGATNASSVVAAVATANDITDQCEYHSDVLQFGVDTIDPVVASANNAMHVAGVVPPDVQQEMLDGMLTDGARMGRG